MRRNYYTRRQACQIGLSGLASLALVDLSACGSGSSSAASETLQLSFWGDASRGKLTKNATKLYKQAHPNVTITSWSADFNSYFNKLNTQIAGGTVPDLIQMDMSYVKEYADEKTLLDLSSLISDKTIDLSDFDQSMLSNSKDNQILYGIPLGGNYECMVCDNDLVTEAGVAAPPTTMTWKQFGEYTNSISQALASKNVYGTQDISGAIDMFEIWVRQRGRELYTTDGKIAFTVDDVASWFDYWGGLRQSGACASAQIQATVTGSGPAATLLVQGKAAFTNAHSNQFSGYQTLSKHQYSLQQVPTGPAAGIYLKPSMLMSIAAKSKYAKEAANFINFIITQPAGVKAIGLDRGVPGSKRALATLNSTLDSSGKVVLAFTALVANGNQTSPKHVLDPAGAGKIAIELISVAQAVGFKKQTVMQGANSFHQQSVQALAQSSTTEGS